MNDPKIPLIPRDDTGENIGLSPAKPALARSVSGSLGTAVEVTFNADATYFEIYAIAQDVYLKYNTAPVAGAGEVVTASNFDEVIPAESQRAFAVPDGVTHLSLLERVAGATAIIVQK